MLDKACNQMNNWRWDSPRAFGGQVGHSNPQKTSSRMVKRAGERFPWYVSDDHRAQIEPPSCQQYKPGDFLAMRPLHWDEIIDEDDDDENSADPGVASSGMRRPGNGNDNDDGDHEVNTQGIEKGTTNYKGKKDGKGKRKATENVNGKG